jgi:hypothetical protein
MNDTAFRNRYLPQGLARHSRLPESLNGKDLHIDLKGDHIVRSADVAARDWGRLSVAAPD